MLCFKIKYNMKCFMLWLSVHLHAILFSSEIIPILCVPVLTTMGRSHETATHQRAKEVDTREQ